MLKVKQKYLNGNYMIQFESEKIYSLGKIIKYKDQKYIVNETEIGLKNNFYFSTVTCTKVGDFKIKSKRNLNIIGSSLKGRVVKIFSEDEKAYMNVDFSEFLVMNFGKIQEFGKNYVSIPYKTFYSQSSTGLFPTPEVNDVVDVIFINEDENNMKVSWSLENENSSRFNDGEKRNYLNKELDLNFNKDVFKVNFKNKVDILGGEIILNSKDILLKTKEKLGLASDFDIAIEANDDLQIYGKEVMIKNKGKSLSFISDGDILLKGKKIHND